MQIWETEPGQECQCPSLETCLLHDSEHSVESWKLKVDIAPDLAIIHLSCTSWVIPKVEIEQPSSVPAAE